MAPVFNPINYDIPLTNRGTTIRASSITCLLIAWIGLGLRLWSRWKMVSALGWDDLFVALAGIATFLGCISLNNQIPNGLGFHWETIVTKDADGSPDYTTYEDYFFWLYLTNTTYALATTCIKLSLLFQYLRLFPRSLYPNMYSICLSLIAIVASWGLCFFILVVFACSPVDKSWHLTKEGTCIMFGDFHPMNAYVAYASQTASNMFLDTIILLVPIPVLAKLDSGKKQRIGLIGLFTAGSLVAICASLRLWLVVKSRAGTYPTVDPPWYAPPVILMSVLEVNLAILTASMPIFWPYLRNMTSGIKVMQEVIVRSEPRHKPPHYYDDNCDDCNDDDAHDSLTLNAGGLGRSASDASNHHHHHHHLKHTHTHSSGSMPIAEQHRKYYGDPAVAELVTGDFGLKADGGDGGVAKVATREFFGGGFDERGGGGEVVTGNQASAWFEPPPPAASVVVALEELEPARRVGADSRV